MALLSAYATTTEYRARIPDQTDGADATLTAQLLSMSREVERALFVAPGMFNTHTGTYIFDGCGGRKLRLRDASGNAYFLQSATTIGIDTERDGTFDGETLALGSGGVRGIPANAAAASEPFHTIELLSYASRTIWPNFPAAVRISSGTFGWAAVPGIITDLVCHRTHELITSLKEGGTTFVPSLTGEIPMRPQTAWLWREAERLYGRKAPRSAAV